MRWLFFRPSDGAETEKDKERHSPCGGLCRSINLYFLFDAILKFIMFE